VDYAELSHKKVVPSNPESLAKNFHTNLFFTFHAPILNLPSLLPCNGTKTDLKIKIQNDEDVSLK
jgi:hypothetical protein